MDEEEGRRGWSEYLVWKGCLVAVQDAGIIQHHPLGDQRDDAVPEPGDHLSVGEGDRLPAEAVGNTVRTQVSEQSQQSTEIIYNFNPITPRLQTNQLLTPRETRKGGSSATVTLQPTIPAKWRSNQFHFLSSEKEKMRRCL